ncbi:MAG: putative metallopeptidase [Myxococcales bacterium]|nr:putative metallopeptidase [Myxococcales bacterium]
MRRALLVCALAACGGNDSPPPTGAIQATVTHYDYAFDIETRVAHATVVATVTTEGDCWSLPLRAQDLANVKLDGVAAKSATVAGGNVNVCGDGYLKDAVLTLDADITIPLATLATSQVGYSITMDKQQNAFYYLVSWVGGCDRFGPCDNRPDQFATYHFTVTHPATFMVRCPGTITETSATVTDCNFDRQGGPTYSTFGVAAYPAWTMSDKGMWDGVHVTVYDRAQTGIDAAIDTTYHTGFVHWMQTTFGPYPYGTDLRVLTAPTYWSGFEHPGNIVLDDALKAPSSYANPVAHVLDHEMAHMWAGDQTTIASTYDFVWKESMAEYLSYVWEDMNDPNIGTITALAWKGFGQAAKYFPVPGDKPQLFDYYGDVYGPGPMILFRQLEVLSSRAQVIAAIQSVLGTPHPLSVDELIAALQAKTGLDLTQYTAAWIKGSGMPHWPRYQLTFAAGSLVVHQVNPSTPALGCKFHVALKGANAAVTTVEVDTFHNGVDQTIPISPAFTVTSLELDPKRECLVFLDSSSPRVVRVNPWVTERGRALDEP